jgi:hypothetical protein
MFKLNYLPLLLMFGVVSAFGQTPAYTQNTTFGCNQEVCNGLPLDQGGTWQFILNGTFSLASNGFYIFGNPGNPGSGGISNVQDGMQLPNRCEGRIGQVTIGPEGPLTFAYAAVNNDRSLHYTGHVVVQGHQVSHCALHGPYYQRVVDSAQIFIDSVN